MRHRSRKQSAIANNLVRLFDIIGVPLMSSGKLAAIFRHNFRNYESLTEMQIYPVLSESAAFPARSMIYHYDSPELVA